MSDEQLCLDLAGNSHEFVVHEFLDRAAEASLPGLSLDHTLCEHQDRWYRLVGIADGLLGNQTARKATLRTGVKTAASAADRRRLQHEIKQIEDAERDLHILATDLWQIAHGQLEAEVERRHGLGCNDDDGDSGWFWNTLSHDRACEAFGSLTLHELARLARQHCPPPLTPPPR